ncbi:MAG: Crp/Fnr family transcriptional regulator [Cyclobacteriaceae bacterium]|nr:Crp/Fnr family transcriptional regulator [Cyclobacteriaceae bacterium]
MNEYLNRIRLFIEQLDEETLGALKNISLTKTFKKGEYLLQQGEVCRHSFWIEKGFVRKFYLNNGNEITTELLFVDDIAVSFNSYTLQTPGHEFIQALTETTVSQTDFHHFQQAKSKFPKLLELDLLMTEYQAIWLENRLFQFHTQDATQRYLHLLKEHPQIIQHIQLTHIASYLGVSLETLSRIRAKI